MNYATIFRVLGIFLMIFSFTMIPPILVSFYFHESEWVGFNYSFMLTLATGLALWILTRHSQKELKVRDGFLIVVLFWFIISFFGAIPFIFAEHPHLLPADAFFESISGLTTTGSTVMNGIDFLPRTILYYRQQLQFLGGMGIVVLAIAITPMLGIGGMQLYRAESTGPAKETKLTPRITQTAKALWMIYVGLTAICAVCYWLAGMPWFYAIGESFSTVSTGGFSMHDDSIAFYDNAMIEIVGTVFMFLGAVNFSLFFISLQRKSLKVLWEDDEFRTFVLLILTICLIVAAVLMLNNTYPTAEESLRKAFFNVVSLLTTTGLTSAPFQSWPSFLPLLMMMGALVGGCASSTAGGLKVIRVLIYFKQSIRELKRLIHPRGVFTLKLGTTHLQDNVIQAVSGFIATFVVIFLILMIALAATGLDFETNFGALIACIANVGVGLGDAAGNFSGLNEPSKWILSIAMLAGRLEIFTLLVLLTPEFWRK